jgi:hypothetical protein
LPHSWSIARKFSVVLSLNSTKHLENVILPPLALKYPATLISLA